MSGQFRTLAMFSLNYIFSFSSGTKAAYLPQMEKRGMWQQRNKWRRIETLSIYLKLCGLTSRDRIPIGVGSFSTKSIPWRPDGGNPKHSKRGNACHHIQ